MNIDKFAMTELRNEEHFRFHTDVVVLIDGDGTPHEEGEGDGRLYTAVTLGIEQDFDAYLIAHNKEDVALELIRKSATTEKIAEADTTRDITVRGLTDSVRTSLQHFNADKREAARQLKVVLDHYGNLAIKGYAEETASIYNLLQELNDNYAAEIALLGIGDWVAQLDADNTAFQTLLDARFAEVAGKTDLRMKEVRKEIDAIYRKITDRIAAQMLLNGEAPFIPFVRDLNARIAFYANVIAQRKGRKTPRPPKGGE
jgi:hypothetical protein